MNIALCTRLRQATIGTLMSLMTIACKSKSDNLQSRTSLKLEPCRLGQVSRELLCTTLQRPRDPEDANAGTLELAVSVLPAWGVNRSTAPPLFLLAGGPGQAAREIYPAAAAAMMQRLGKTRDIVLMDIRGTGDSDPLDCELSEDEDYTLSLNDTLSKGYEELKRCRAQMGPRKPHHYFTPVLADDIDAVRSALGYDKISLFGASYGTRLAMEYVRRHNAHTDRVVLDGIAPVQLALPWHYAETYERSWNKISDYCEQDKDCNRRFPQMRSSLRRLITKLEQDKPTYKIQHPLRDKVVDFRPDPDYVRMFYFPPAYSATTWTLIPLAVDKALQGDWGPTFALLQGTSDMKLNPITLHAIVCNEDRRQWRKDEADAAMKASLLSDAQLRNYQKICPLFTSEHPLPASHFEPIRSDRPVLLLSGDGDPVTPPGWAKQVQKNFPNSLELTVPFTGHNTTQLPCVEGIVEAFLSDSKPLEVDTACVKDTPRPYFFTSKNGPSHDFSAAQSLKDTP